MPFPIIDNTLLERYHKGECSPEEIRQVELWLEEGDDIVAPFSDDQLSAIEERMWKKIRPQGIRRSRYRMIIQAGIAASILFFLYLIVYDRIEGTSTKQTYNLTQLKSRSLDLQGLNFRLVGAGNATVFSRLDRQNGNISFCGVVEISNNSSKDIQYTLNYGCGPKDLGETKRFLLKKGKTYIAMLDRLNSEKVIVMRKEHLIEFPDMMPIGVERI